jgi:hypothetical protein
MDGRFAYSSTGEIMDVARKKIVAALRDETGPGRAEREAARLDNRERKGGSSGKSVRHRHEAEVNQFGPFFNRPFRFGALAPATFHNRILEVTDQQDTIDKRCLISAAPVKSDLI